MYAQLVQNLEKVNASYEQIYLDIIFHTRKQYLQ